MRQKIKKKRKEFYCVVLTIFFFFFLILLLLGFKKKNTKNDKQKGLFQYKFSPALKFTPEQVNTLEETFQNEPYAKGKSLTELATRLNAPLKRVQNWFKHKRSRLAQQGKFEFKPRNVLNSEQITFLRDAFAVNSTPTPEICEQLSNNLNVKMEQITRWFSNERSKKRKRDEHQIKPGGRRSGGSGGGSDLQPQDNPLSEEETSSYLVDRIEDDEMALKHSSEETFQQKSKRGRKSKLSSAAVAIPVTEEAVGYVTK
jgi:hypothetical protein